METRGGGGGGGGGGGFPPPPPPLRAPRVSLVPKTAFPFQTPATQATYQNTFEITICKTFLLWKGYWPATLAIKSNGNLIRPDLKKFKCWGVAQGVAKGSKCVVLF